MQRTILAFATATALLAPGTVGAIEPSLSLQLGAGTDFERRIVQYSCSEGEPFQVTYINAAPNFLAIVPVADEPQPYLFVAVVAGSGARYAAGNWIWWTSGADASLYDATLGEDADPILTCAEAGNTP